MSLTRPPIVAGPISRKRRVEIAELNVAAGGVGAGVGAGVAAVLPGVAFGVGFGCAMTPDTTTDSSKHKRPMPLRAHNIFIIQILENLNFGKAEIQKQTLCCLN